MDVINRYFRTLRILLPKDHKDDIIRELSEEVRSHIAEKEAALGRSLNSAEQSALIGCYGHPLVTAARYRPQRHLIGPVVFPYYWIVLRTTLVLVAMGHLLGAAVLLAGGATAGQIGQLVETAISTALKVTAWITALGAAADFCLARGRVMEGWRPSAGSPLPQHAHHVIAFAAANVPRALHPGLGQPRTSEPSVSGLIVGLLLGVWWLAGLRFPFLFFGSGGAGLEWGPAMDRLYPVLFVAQLTMLAEQFIKYTGYENARLFRMARSVWSIAGLALIYVVATSDYQWMVWRADSLARANGAVVKVAGRQMSLVDFINVVWSIVFIAVALSSAWAFVRALFKRARGTAMTAHA